MLTAVFRLLVARQRQTLPRAQEIELAEFLIEPHRVVAHTLFRIVVAHLDETGHWEVLAQWVTVETVVGQDAAQIRMALEHHAEQVINLALELVSAWIDGGSAGDRGILVSLDLDSDPTV